jgi:hypothetical protein
MKQRIARLVTASPIMIGLARGAVNFCFGQRTGKLIGGRNGRLWNVWQHQFCVSGRKKTKQKEETHADLTEELKAEVKAIQETERESVNGDSLFGQVWGGKDELILSSILCRCKN